MAAHTRPARFDLVLLFLSVCLYLGTHLPFLERFPVYFFADEAIQTVKARELARNGFLDEFGDRFPLLMRRFDHFNLGATVYLHMPGMLLFGHRIWAVRGLTALLSLAGTLWLAGAAKRLFGITHAWTIVLYASAVPLFFLHSRTGFEAPIAVSFYAGFLYYYARYRTDRPWHILSASFCAALSFYSAPGLWLTVLASYAFFIAVDFRRHRQRLAAFLSGLALTLLLFVPFIRFQLLHHDLMVKELSVYNSYLSKETTQAEKIGQGAIHYLTALSPRTLFFPDTTHNPRHTLKNQGYFPLWSWPVVFVGLIFFLWRHGKKMEGILFAGILLAVPLGSIVNGFSPTRSMQFLIPVAWLFGIAVDTLLTLTHKSKKNAAILFVFFFLAGNTVSLAYDSIRNGPTWFPDYGLYGMQFGAKEVFRDTVPALLTRYSSVTVNPDFANATDIFIPFFLPPDLRWRVSMANIHDYTLEHLEKNELSGFDSRAFVATPADYERLLQKGYVENIRMIKTIPAPDGTVAFYVWTFTPPAPGPKRTGIPSGRFAS